MAVAMHIHKPTHQVCQYTPKYVLRLTILDCIDGFIDGRTGRRTEGWMDGWMDG